MTLANNNIVFHGNGTFMVITQMEEAIMIIIVWNIMTSKLTQISLVQHLLDHKFVKVLHHKQIFMEMIYSYKQ